MNDNDVERSEIAKLFLSNCPNNTGALRRLKVAQDEHLEQKISTIFSFFLPLSYLIVFYEHWLFGGVVFQLVAAICVVLVVVSINGYRSICLIERTIGSWKVTPFSKGDRSFLLLRWKFVPIRDHPD